MSENEEEPSIEEILSSIRQIISDDDEEEAAPAQEAPPPEEHAPEEPEEDLSADDDVLELTEDMQEEPEPEPEPEPEIEEEEEEEIEIDLLDSEPDDSALDDSIISDAAKAAALASMAKLAGNMPVSRRPGYNGVTVEDIVRELLNPMLREWMDGNLSEIVEKIVQKEIAKLGRRAADD